MIDMLKGTVTSKDWMFVGVVLGLTLVVCAVFFFFVYQPELERLDTTKSQLNQARQERSRAQELAANIHTLRAETAQITKLVTEFEERLPSEREIAILLTQFEDIAGDVGGLDLEMRPQTPRTEGTKLTIPYRIVVRGNYHRIAEFVNRLERFRRYLKVSDLRIERQRDGVTEAEFTLSTYTFVEQGTGGAA